MMNKYFIRKIALMLAMILTFSTIGIHLSGKAVNAAVSGEWSYSISGSAVSIIGYRGSDTNVVIPSTINGNTVTRINDRAFAGNTNIQYVTLPKQTIEIGSGAFNGCTSLKTVYNSEYATVIYTGAFAGCTSLSSFKFSTNLTALGDSTFRKTALTEIYLPKSVNSLRQYTFANCSSLTKVYIASSTLTYQDTTIFQSSNVTLYAPANSTTQSFASANGYSFIEYTPPADEDESESETGGSGGDGEDEDESGTSGNSGNEDCEHEYLLDAANSVIYYCMEYLTFKCAFCDASYTEVVEYEEDHQFGDWVIDKEATETETGEKSKYCSECGKRTEITVIPVISSCTEHKYEFTRVITASTCTSAGTKLETCSICNIATREVSIDALGHSYSDWVIDTQPTYTSTGVKSKYCTTCGNRGKITVIDKLICTDHNYQFTKTITGATCTSTGIDLETCSICKISTREVTTSTKSHSYGDFVTDIEPTYTTTGEKSKHCSVCGTRTEITIIPVRICTDHNYEYTCTTTQPTCIKTGVELHTCTVCGATINKTAPTIAHKYGNFVIDKEPTYTEAGEKSKYCTMCNGKTEITKIPMLVCSSHNYEYTKTATEATCTQTGSAIHTCTICSGTKEVSIPKESHTYGSWVIDKEPTYAEPGEKSKHCTVCDARTEITEIPQLIDTDHTYVFSKTIKAATCTETGTDLYICTRAGCGSTIEMVTAKTAHTYGDWITDKQATYHEAGEKSKHCTVCDTRTEITEIPQLESAPAVSGDCDGDNKISITDAVSLKKLLAGTDDGVNKSAADINKDGTVNIADAVMLMKHLAGIDVGLGEF